MGFEMIAADKTDANGALFSKVATAMVAYSICSSTLLLANKTTMIYLPRPGIINSVQIIFSLFFMFFVRLSGVNIDKLEWHKAKHYIIYVSAFTISRYANMKALQHSNVETVIVFRSCAPLAVSIVEFTLMGRSFPSLRSCSSLIAVCFGACLYCYSDSEFSVNGFKAYSWVSLYFLLLVFEMTYCKKLTASAKMKSKWGPVFYCNFLAAAPTLLLAFTAGEFEGLSDEVTDISFVGYAVLLFSCFAGTFIGYTSWIVIDLVSATTYTLVGVVNKFFTAFLNIIVWDKHSTPIGLVAVSICLGAGVFYQQAPMRSKEV